MENIKPLAVLAGSVVTAAGAFLLYNKTKDEYGAQRHKILEILEELKMAYIPIYVRCYNIYTNARKEIGHRENGEELCKTQILETSKFFRQNLHSLVNEQTHHADQEICEKHGISVDELKDLLEVCENEPEVKEMQELIEANTQNIFDGKRPNFNLEYPETITSELYFELLTTIFEVVRHELYCRIRLRIRENSGSKLSQKHAKSKFFL